MTKDFYQILGISKTATQEEIKRAYRKLALKWHPDKNPNNQEEAKKKFQEINKAYGVLSNEEFKKRYDNGETDFSTDCGGEQEKSFWEAKEEKLAEEVKIMEDLLKSHKERQDALEKIWLLNAEYLERWDTWFDVRNTFDTTFPRVFKEDLDRKYNKLWEPYQDWLDKVWSIPLNLKRGVKEHSDELKKFKEEMIKAIKEAEIALKIKEEKKKKDEEASELNQARNDAFGYIQKEMNKKGLTTQDLGEYSNYKKRINNLSEIWYIRNFREEVISYIYKLGRKEPKQAKKDNNNYNNQNNIQVLREQSISDIKNALTTPEPKLTNSDLDFEYQNWETKLNGFLEESEISSWKDKVLAHIQFQRKTKQTSQKVNDDFKKTQDPNASVQDKKKALDELDKNEGQQAYEEKKEKIKETKKEVAKDSPNEYRNKIISVLDKKLAENGLNESDLDEQTKQGIKDLKNSKLILEPEKLVESEIRIIEKIGQIGAKKKIDNLAFEVKEVFKTKDKTRVKKLIKSLLEIMNSSSVYYHTHKYQAEQLLKKLENITNFDSNQKPNFSNPFPLSVKIGIGAVVVLVVGFLIVLIWRRKRK